MKSFINSLALPLFFAANLTSKEQNQAETTSESNEPTKLALFFNDEE